VKRPRGMRPPSKFQKGTTVSSWGVLFPKMKSQEKIRGQKKAKGVLIGSAGWERLKTEILSAQSFMLGSKKGRRKGRQKKSGGVGAKRRANWVSKRVALKDQVNGSNL